MSFSTVYVVGGTLDKVRSVGRLEEGRLDAPFMPTKTIPYIKGDTIEVASNQRGYSKTVELEFDAELLSVAVGASRYAHWDSWSVKVGNDTIISSIYTKDMPEGVNLMVAHPVPAGTKVTFQYDNKSMSNKYAWFNLQFLKDSTAE